MMCAEGRRRDPRARRRWHPPRRHQGPAATCRSVRARRPAPTTSSPRCARRRRRAWPRGLVATGRGRPPARLIPRGGADRRARRRAGGPRARRRRGRPASASSGPARLAPPQSLRELFVTFADPGAIGLSVGGRPAGAAGARLRPRPARADRPRAGRGAAGGRRGAGSRDRRADRRRRVSRRCYPSDHPIVARPGLRRAGARRRARVRAPRRTASTVASAPGPAASTSTP